jgi:predicted GNAT family N-acyltransferase
LLQEEVPQQPLEADSGVYCMADGRLLFTDDAWQEVKLGRLFIESTGRQQPLSRPFIEKSQ